MVRRRLNSHNPTILKLPSEILTTIVSHLKINPTFLVNASHVCHHWRVALLSCPNLWTSPNFARMDQALAFLRLSEPFPIHVNLTSIVPSSTLVELLCLHSARVYALQIDHFCGLEELFSKTLASLRTLEVATPEEPRQCLTVRSSAREFLALTSLTIKHSYCALAFRGPSITHLRILIPYLSRLGVAQLFNLFRSCILLEELAIGIQTGLELSLRLLSDEVVSLPHLRSFAQTLHSSTQWAGVLNNLNLPPSCSVVLWCVVGIAYGFPPLSFPALRNTAYYTNVKRVKVVYTGGCLGNKASTAVVFINDRGTRSTTITEFLNHATNLSDQHPAMLSGSAAEVLCVDRYGYVTLQSYRFLTTPILSGPIVRLYLELLAEPERRDMCKSLRTLVLSVTPRSPTSDIVKRLLDVAKTRAKAGLLLRTVTFACPSVLAPNDLTALEGLRECVQRVELLLGDDTLDWNLDKYFLNGL